MQFSLYDLGNVYTQYTAINHVFLNLNIYDILWYCIILYYDYLYFTFWETNNMWCYTV